MRAEGPKPDRLGFCLGGGGRDQGGGWWWFGGPGATLDPLWFQTVAPGVGGNQGGGCVGRGGFACIIYTHIDARQHIIHIICA